MKRKCLLFRTCEYFSSSECHTWFEFETIKTLCFHKPVGSFLPAVYKPVLMIQQWGLALIQNYSGSSQPSVCRDDWRNPQTSFLCELMGANPTPCHCGKQYSLVQWWSCNFYSCHFFCHLEITVDICVTPLTAPMQWRLVLHQSPAHSPCAERRQLPPLVSMCPGMHLLHVLGCVCLAIHLSGQ